VHTWSALGSRINVVHQLFDTKAGEQSTIDLETYLRPPANENAPAETSVSREAHASRWPPTLSYVAFAIAGVSTGVGAYFGAQTLAARDDFDAHPSPDARDAFFERRLITNVAFGIASLGVLVGAGIWFLLSPPKPHDTTPTALRRTLAGGLSF
jgi:hypothetical protein